MKTVRRKGNQSQRSNWGSVLRVLNSDSILRSIEMGNGNRIRIETATWEQYWDGIQARAAFDADRYLDALRTSRLRYIQSGFDIRYAVPYCHAYFSLLRFVLDQQNRGNTDRDFLWAVLGFENTALRWVGKPTSLAAITTSARNPIYLLSKIREPQAYEDPKFLPLATVFAPSGTRHDRVPLFYHYRQFAAGVRGSPRILVCPPVDVEERPESMKGIQFLGAALTRKHDTRVTQRSHRIAELAVGPVLENLFQRSDRANESEIFIADLGGGSGDLTRGIIEHVSSGYPGVVHGRRFAWTMVDLGFQKPKRHFRNWDFFRKLSRYRCIRSDYSSWVADQTAGGDGKPYHVILACRLLNNTSCFSIDWVDDWYQVSKLSKRKLPYHTWKAGSYLPHRALHSDSIRTESLIASNARIPLLNGSTFCQLSLSDYYRGLHMLTEEPPPRDIRSEAVFFPIRRFNEPALVLPSGASVLEKLCRLGDIVIIEDVDLDARLLRRHLSSRNLCQIAATEATDRSRMHGANLLCLCANEYLDALPGRRIW